eukprot:4567103-Prymnesium_polylepis.1
MVTQASDVICSPGPVEQYSSAKRLDGATVKEGMLVGVRISDEPGFAEKLAERFNQVLDLGAFPAPKQALLGGDADALKPPFISKLVDRNIGTDPSRGGPIGIIRLSVIGSLNKEPFLDCPMNTMR